jgi:quercetin 2,3-dioxygenase
MQFLAIENVESVGHDLLSNAEHRLRLVISPDQAVARNPFLALAEDWIAPNAGLPLHPHRGMETVTFILEGQMLHEDHMGGRSTLKTGDVQFMTAGSGVLHSEMPGPSGVHSLQLWLNLPAHLKRTPPRYRDIRRDNVPVHRETGVEARVYAGRVGDAHSPHGSTWPLVLVDVHLNAGASFNLELPSGYRTFAYLVEGYASFGQNNSAVDASHVVWFRAAERTGAVELLRIASDSGARVLIYSSPIISEPIVMKGPFVMNTEQEVDEAFTDYRAGRLIR